MDERTEDRGFIPLPGKGVLPIVRRADPARALDTPTSSGEVHRGAGLKKLALIVLAAALAGGLAGGALESALGGSGEETAGAQTQAPSVESASAAEPVAPGKALSAEEIYRRDAPGVVVITATQTQQIAPTPFTPGQKEEVRVLGSGFVIDRSGDIVTNDHVVADAAAVRVGFSNNATYPAKVLGGDPSTDVAVVRVNAPASALHALVWADSSRVEVGDPVYAIGNPFGLDRTLTNGIVSATGRDIQAPNGLAIQRALQTNAAINHGNSGGPLIDRFGRVIGINSQIESGGVNGNVGVGFAVPSDTARAVAGQLIGTGHVEHAWLGVAVEDIVPELASVLRGIPQHGVLIVDVRPGSPAAKAGLRAGHQTVTVGGESAVVGGDAIVSLDGAPVDSSSRLVAMLADHKPGDQVQLGIVREGQDKTVTVTLGNAPSSG
ncbi:MAG TPA: trypsin-like peptidase domain-containing protein [Gaiellaceae bacterium]